MAKTNHDHDHAHTHSSDDTHCRLCQAELEPDAAGFVAIECVKAASGIGFYFQNWCEACQDKFRDSDTADQLNTELARFIRKAAPKPARKKKSAPPAKKRKSRG